MSSLLTLISTPCIFQSFCKFYETIRSLGLLRGSFWNIPLPFQVSSFFFKITDAPWLPCFESSVDHGIRHTESKNFYRSLKPLLVGRASNRSFSAVNFLLNLNKCKFQFFFLYTYISVISNILVFNTFSRTN